MEDTQSTLGGLRQGIKRIKRSLVNTPSFSNRSWVRLEGGFFLFFFELHCHESALYCNLLFCKVTRRGPGPISLAMVASEMINENDDKWPLCHDK